jgi:hypothetical protein
MRRNPSKMNSEITHPVAMLFVTGKPKTSNKMEALGSTPPEAWAEAAARKKIEAQAVTRQGMGRKARED